MPAKRKIVRRRSRKTIADNTSRDAPQPSSASTGSSIGLFDTGFDYWQLRPHQVGVENEWDQVIYPSSKPAEGAPWEFTFTNGVGIYINLSSTIIEIVARITKGDGTALEDADNDRIGIINNFGHSMWSNIEVVINGKTVTEAGNLYAIKALFCHLLSHSPDSLQTKGIVACGYKGDTAGHVDSNNTSDAGNNKGLVERSKLFRRSKKVTMCIRPYVGIFGIRQYFPDNSTVTIRLYPSQHRFCLISSQADASFKVDVSSVRVIAHTIEANVGITMAQARMLAQTGPIRLPFDDMSIVTRTITTGVTNYIVPAMFTSRLPRRVTAMLINNEHMNGTYTTNPLYAQNFGVTNASLNIDGQEFPREGYKTDFSAATTSYTEAYNKVLEGLELNLQNSGIDLTPELWANGITFFTFKISAGAFNGVTSQTRTGNTTLSFTFSSPTTVTINCVLLAEYQSELQIDEQRNVMIV